MVHTLQLDPLLRGDIPRAVYSSALDKTGNDPLYALELIAVLRQFPRTSEMRSTAYANLGTCAVSIAALCRRPIEDIGPEDEGMNEAEVNTAIDQSKTLFKTALGKKCAGSDLHELYVGFIKHTIQKDGDTSAVCGTQDIVDTCAAAHDAGVASKSLYETWIDETLRRSVSSSSRSRKAGSHYAEVLSVAEKATTAPAATACDCDLWLRRIGMTVAAFATDPKTLDEHVDDVYEAALSAVNQKDAVRVLATRIKYCLAYRALDETQQAFTDCIKAHDVCHFKDFKATSAEGAAQEVFNPRADFVEWTNIQFGIGPARSLYSRYFVGPNAADCLVHEQTIFGVGTCWRCIAYTHLSFCSGVCSLLRQSPVQLGYATLQRFINLELAQVPHAHQLLLLR